MHEVNDSHLKTIKNKWASFFQRDGELNFANSMATLSSSVYSTDSLCLFPSFIHSSSPIWFLRKLRTQDYFRSHGIEIVENVENVDQFGLCIFDSFSYLNYCVHFLFCCMQIYVTTNYFCKHTVCVCVCVLYIVMVLNYIVLYTGFYKL